jgi:hypothetical protein
MVAAGDGVGEGRGQCAVGRCERKKEKARGTSEDDRSSKSNQQLNSTPAATSQVAYLYIQTGGRTDSQEFQVCQSK